MFNQLDDAVVEFTLGNDEPIIQDVNETFTDVFGYETEEISGLPLNDFIVPITEKEKIQQFGRREPPGLASVGFVRGITADGNRTFIYRGASCNGDHGFAIYTEVSNELRRERHLSILQRVLRHNLRNELNVVIGRSREIIEHTDETQVMHDAATIKDAASRLSRLSDEAKIVKNVLEEPAVLEPTNVTRLVTDVVGDCQSRFNTCEIELDLPETLLLRADERLEIVFQNLIDNAIRHNDSRIPRVEVYVSDTDDTTVDIAVADNGPGIPQVEQQIMTGNHAIDPLNHGSGIGVWLVKWVVEMCGGEIEIETPDDGGTIVTTRLDRPMTD